MRFLEFFKSRYVLSLEQRVEELKSEKADLKAEVERLQKLLVPGLRQMEREENAFTRAAKESRPVVAPKDRIDVASDKPEVIRMPPAKSWMEVRGQLEQLSVKEQ